MRTTALALCGLVMALLSDLPSLADAPVSFPDPALESIIRVALQRPAGDLLESDLAGVTALHCQGGDRSDPYAGEVLDLTGIEYCTNLRRLSLEYTRIVDIGPLRALTALEDLTIAFAPCLTDLAPLASLSSLRKLFLEHLNTADIGPLARLSSLTSLLLRSCPMITDLSPLSGLARLDSVQAYSCSGLSDLSPLADLAGLTVVVVLHCPVADLTPISGAAQLRWLNVGDCAVSDISPLLANPGLGAGDRVDVRGNNLCLYCSGGKDLSDISALAARGVTVLYDRQKACLDVAPLDVCGQPTILSVTASPSLLLDRDIGSATFSITVEYDETMDTAVAPLLAPTLRGYMSLNEERSGWLSSTVYVARYDVEDSNRKGPFGVEVSEGRDLLGNAHLPQSFANVYSVNQYDLLSVSGYVPHIASGVWGGAVHAPGYVLSHSDPGARFGWATVPYGSSVAFTITPDPHYHIDRLFVMTGNQSGWVDPTPVYTFGSVVAYSWITAYFAPDQYLLSTAVQGAGTVTPGTGTYEYGSAVEVLASPEIGWEFVEWTGDLVGTANPATVTMDSDKAITAVFAAIDPCSVRFAELYLDRQDMGHQGDPASELPHVFVNLAVPARATITVDIPFVVQEPGFSDCSREIFSGDLSEGLHDFSLGTVIGSCLKGAVEGSLYVFHLAAVTADSCTADLTVEVPTLGIGAAAGESASAAAGKAIPAIHGTRIDILGGPSSVTVSQSEALYVAHGYVWPAYNACSTRAYRTCSDLSFTLYVDGAVVASRQVTIPFAWGACDGWNCFWISEFPPYSLSVGEHVFKGAWHQPMPDTDGEKVVVVTVTE